MAAGFAKSDEARETQGLISVQADAKPTFPPYVSTQESPVRTWAEQWVRFKNSKEPFAAKWRLVVITCDQREEVTRLQLLIAPFTHLLRIRVDCLQIFCLIGSRTS